MQHLVDALTHHRVCACGFELKTELHDELRQVHEFILVGLFVNTINKDLTAIVFHLLPFALTSFPNALGNGSVRQ